MIALKTNIAKCLIFAARNGLWLTVEFANDELSVIIDELEKLRSDYMNAIKVNNEIAHINADLLERSEEAREIIKNQTEDLHTYVYEDDQIDPSWTAQLISDGNGWLAKLGVK